MTKTAKRAKLTAKSPVDDLHWMILDDAGRIVAVADPPYHCGEGEVELPLPPAAEGENLLDWRYQDGAWIHDPLPPEVPPEACFRIDEVIEILLNIQALCVEMMTFLQGLGGGQ